ncbi:MAG: hypothetical protein J0J10_14530 [Bosea sp.]|uniref:hypothetical protein n=1 Tax=Bosea sp. (in: a-proteobacteria) TaxID=1871050 RepID=UPI001AC0F864|nr:hypothetical protein [Bosea sp. (in: a-proteobacteria)]MBN9469979.1 hypothetical protein [Bosea sp. (in: a-proteobacteria)]
MNRHHIALLPAEEELLAQIDLRDSFPPGTDAHAIYQTNKAPIVALLRSLVDRDAIPKRRLALWTDPALQPGRARGSHRDLFAANDSRGPEAFTHPHFKTFLRYFLFGADLPQPAIDEFEKQIGNPEWFGGSDIIALAKRTREIVRKYGLRHYSHADEFQRLALDNGLSNDHVASVRKAAMEAARR